MIAALPYIYSIGAAQAFILSLVLWKMKINVVSNKILAIWLLFLFIDLSVKALFLYNNNRFESFFYLLIQFFPFLYGSFFYLYVRSLITKQMIKFKDILHFSAFIVFLTINIPALFGLFNLNPVGLNYYDPVLYISSVSYVIAGMVLIFKYRKDLSSQQVDIKEVNLQWLMVMGYSQILIWLIAVSQWLIPIQNYNHWTIYIAVSIWIIVMGYLSHSQQNISPITPLKSSPLKINSERFDEVEKKIDLLVESKKIHLQPNLTIGQLATFSGYPEYLISLYINRKHGMNFHDFINKLRITNAMYLLKSQENQTILDIAYACGYNSKSTFNVAFKKHTQQTPSQFKQQNALN